MDNNLNLDLNNDITDPNSEYYKLKYLKYKFKYLQLDALLGGKSKKSKKSKKRSN